MTVPHWEQLWQPRKSWETTENHRQVLSPTTSDISEPAFLCTFSARLCATHFTRLPEFVVPMQNVVQASILLHTKGDHALLSNCYMAPDSWKARCTPNTGPRIQRAATKSKVCV